ncbi:TIGR04206 family protein [Halobacteriaceae archaeon GCM10025711]
MTGRHTSTTSRPATSRRRLAALLAPAVLPWSLFFFGGDLRLVFAWGLVNPGSVHVVTLWEYLFSFTMGPASLPGRLLAWPVGTLLYVLALASAFGGRVLREDRRLTVGLLALAGGSHLGFAVGNSRPGTVAVPVGVVVLWAVAWWDWTR